ncbi:MAG: alpha/beta fold hydrolase [Dehalococcoidia bacterium]
MRHIQPAGGVRYVDAWPARLAITVRGEGEAVICIPSLGRGGGDFDDLAGRLAEAGFRAITFDPRGFGKSTGKLDVAGLGDFAADVAAIIERTGAAPAHVVGHAFGNRVARYLAWRRPELVRSLTLLACGGQVAGDAEAQRALNDTFRLDLPAEEHLRAVQTAFFAAGHDASVWREGWSVNVARSQRGAIEATGHGDWQFPWDVPILIVQGLDDRIAPPANGRILKLRLGDAVTLVELAEMGHAILPEQPERIAAEVVGFLRTTGGKVQDERGTAGGA